MQPAGSQVPGTAAGIVIPPPAIGGLVYFNNAGCTFATR
jgi:hypothetical protein